MNKKQEFRYEKCEEDIYNNISKTFERTECFRVLDHAYAGTIDLVAHKSFEKPQEWSVSELITGFRIYSSSHKNRNRIVSKTVQVITGFGSRKILSVVDNTIRQDFNNRHLIEDKETNKTKQLVKTI